MIYFIQKEGFRFTLEGLKDDPDAPPHRICTYSALLSQKWLSPGTYIFTDRERMDPWELRIFGDLFNHLEKSGPGYRAVNNPARIKNRFELLRTLYNEKLNDFNVYLVSENRMPERYPVFIRRINDHKAPLTGLLETSQELETALETLHEKNEPDENLIIVEYCAQPVSDGYYKKHSAFRAGDNVFFYHTMVDETWLIKLGMSKPWPEEICQEDFDKVKNNAHAAELERAFDIANIEYGRADFSIVDGKVQVYEINTNPHLKPLGELKFRHPLRDESIKLARKKLTMALKRLDDTDSKAQKAGRFCHPDIETRLLFPRIEKTIRRR